MENVLQDLAKVVDQTLTIQPVLLLFFVIGLGYLLGNLRLNTFAFGPVAGVLFAGLFLGHFGFRITPAAQAIGFAMFIFSVGYQAGPRFFAVLKEDGAKYFVLALFVGVIGFTIAAIGAWLLQLKPGASAGLLAGGLTSSPTLAAAQEAVRTGSVPLQEGWSKDQVIGNIATSYAITYIFGLAGLIAMIKLLPGWVGIDLAKEAEKMTSKSREGDTQIPVNTTTRCYRVNREEFTRPTISELREKYWDNVTVIKLVRNGKLVDANADSHLQLGDELELIGPRSFFTTVAQHLGEEILPKWDIVEYTDSAQIVVTNKAVFEHRLADFHIAQSFGLMLVRIQQMGVNVPIENDLILQKGDILTVTGPSQQINALGDTLGFIERDISETDMVTFAFGIVAGVIFGLFSVTVGGVSIGLGSAGGLLLSGLLIGYLRSVRPTFGRLPEAARWLLMEFGLLIFMAGVGLRAGGDIIETLMEAGPLLIVAGIFVTLVPILAGYWFGRKVLKIEPVLLFGAITGAMTSGAALGVVTKAAKSPVPALGYTGTYAFANVLLMVAGSLILLI